ncbi:hypothetical protein EJ03DRAFT_329471 [Teratosphaeria nubilosa]|uniref:PHD-type domain-containing protein n=1 Tax=Teratosphaeria nubilosa TaxID=161662 RepID=A0A6G1L489_9PEZI|nr:hypothetical protein EJ03DRAFT_329471 [Teratosphaeria nubilosa]
MSFALSNLLNPEPARKEQASQSPSNTHDAAAALSALSSTSAPSVGAWYEQGQERRASSFGPGAMDLPRPNVDRKMSSPTLEAYQVASRKSPDARRESMPSLAQPAAITLPPMQRMQVAHDTTTTSHASPSTSPASNPFSTLTALPAASPPPAIKQEILPPPPASSPLDPRPVSQYPADAELKAMAKIKGERAPHSPLRESSVPVPSTELTAPEPTTSKKRPAPRSKKGTATATKKAPPAKKRKVELERSATPSSRASKPAHRKLGDSTKGTPLNSSPAPSNRSDSRDREGEDDDADEDEDVEGSGEVYCLCRKPDNGTFMIGCDGKCDDWFHGKCVNIKEENKHLIDKYLCPNCEKAGVGITTWKRMCRRSRCKQPARVGSSKSGKDGSKYCSDECGVAYFRELAAATRDKQSTYESRASRRKGSIVSDGRTDTDDLGARGGVLAAGEVKALVNASKTAEDFKKLGEGVLSPPATPDGKEQKGQDGYTEQETAALEQIHKQKEQARHRHQLLKDRMKFVTMVKQAASRTATEKELKPKEYCGYDPRLEWTEEEFAAFRTRAVGKQAFELETLAVEKSSEKTEDGHVMEGVLGAIDVCERKKCARHLEWGKLAVDDLRFEMGDNSDNMRALDREEKEIRERAVIRAKAGSLAEGTVEIHVEPLRAGDAMEVDGPVPDGPVMEPETAVVVDGGEAMVVDAAAAAAAAAA